MTSKELLKLRNKILCFDIDGTITQDKVITNFKETTIGDHAHWFSKALPNNKMISLVNKLAKNNQIILYTTRNDFHRELTIKWLKENGVKYDFLIFNKPFYDYIIDDKAINAEDL